MDSCSASVDPPALLLSLTLDKLPQPCFCQTMKGSQQDTGPALISAGH